MVNERNYSDYIVAYFRTRSGAENAIRELRDAGFGAHQIGYSGSGPMSAVGVSAVEREDDRSFWDKVGDFFTGRGDDYSASESTSTSHSLRIPERYHDRLANDGAMVAVYDSSRLNEAEQILSRNGGEIDRDRASFAVGTAAAGPVHDERRIQLLSEVLNIRKQRVSQGDVRLRKEVQTERQNVEVPLTREELVIERSPASGREAANRDVSSGEEIRVPLSEERVDVQKRPIVREEVRVGKRPVEETETVSEDVRSEELKVEDERHPGTKEPKRRKTA